MRSRHSATVVVCAAALLLVWAVRASASTVRYALTPESYIVPSCESCEGPAPRESLQGSFDLTFLQVPTEYAVEALTGVGWQSDSFEITGSGFLQRLGTDRLAMVIDATVNGRKVLFTSGRRQLSSTGQIRIVLATPRGAEPAYLLQLVAVAVATDGPDADSDGIPDGNDNCRETQNRDQLDADHDRVGDACDSCPDTPAGEAVQNDGCAPSQVCPCDGPVSGGEWPNQRAYTRCLSRVLRKLWREEKLSREEVLSQIREAVRSACGRRFLAHRFEPVPPYPAVDLTAYSVAPVR